MKINNLLLQPGANVFYDANFRIILEDHMSYLKSLSTTRIVQIDSVKAYKYEGDFYGLLQNLNYSPQNFFIILRMNDLTSPADYREHMRTLLIPDDSEISRIRSAFKTKSKT